MSFFQPESRFQTYAGSQFSMKTLGSLRIRFITRGPRLIVLGCVFCGIVAPVHGAEEGLPVFTDVTREAGISFVHNNGSGGNYFFPETVGSGCGWIDADGDGWLDLYFVNACDLPGRESEIPARNVLYRNNRDGTFTDVTDIARVGDTGYGVGCAVADYDNDGDQDLFVANLGPNRLYRNRGDGTFDDVSAEAGVDHPRYNSGVAFLDYDLDGHLDLYVASYIQWSATSDIPCTRIAGGKEHRIYCAPQQYEGLKDILFHNEGDGTFQNVSADAGIEQAEWNGLGVVCGDFDMDGDPDIYVGDDASPNLFWINQGDGTFVDDALLSGTGYAEGGLFENGMGVTAGDYDRDGIWDLLVNNFQMQPTSLYRGLGDGMFEHVSIATKIAVPSTQRLSWGIHLFDYDKDGWEDIFSANGHIYYNVELFSPDITWAQTDYLFRNNGDGTFSNLSEESGEYFSIRYPSRGSAFGDYDNDGDLDIAICMNDASAVLLRNDAPKKNHWLLVALQGTESNRSGIGAVVTVRTGEAIMKRERRAGEGFASSCDPRLHFGLSDASSVEEITVDWPSGKRDRLLDVAADQILHVTEGHLGSNNR
jgi:hypothetical protein